MQKYNKRNYLMRMKPGMHPKLENKKIIETKYCYKEVKHGKANRNNKRFMT